MNIDLYWFILIDIDWYWFWYTILLLIRLIRLLAFWSKHQHSTIVNALHMVLLLTYIVITLSSIKCVGINVILIIMKASRILHLVLHQQSTKSSRHRFQTVLLRVISQCAISMVSSISVQWTYLTTKSQILGLHFVVNQVKHKLQ